MPYPCTQKIVYYHDDCSSFADKLTSKETLRFVYGPQPEEKSTKTFLENEHYYALLTLSDSTLKKIDLVAVDQPSLSTVGYIESQLADVLKQRKLEGIGVSKAQIEEINDVNIQINTAKATDEGSESSSAAASSAIGFAAALLIYMFIFLYGVQVMRGVIEEKTNRIVEVIISSLKPFELMMGKIIGIALVGLTQFVIWIVLVTILGGGSSGLIASQMNISPEAQGALAQSGKAVSESGSFINALLSFNYTYLISVFLFYFTAGYLFYGALFAAIGSAVDNETDTQQFMLPVTMPLVLALVLAQSAVISNPNGAMAFWLSIIPFTSPVVMMVRMPFGVPTWELFLSMGCMILGFIATVWLAGRIYRIGILMYGKKPSYKEIGKWLFAKG
ncbi:MAG: ABC transporter permease [Bacteroidota bacterium]